MAGGTFRIQDVRKIAETISSKAKFPLTGFDDLAKALGGPEATIKLGQQGHKVSEARQIPAEFYPIESAEDLFVKLAFLRAAGGDRAEGMEAGKQEPSAPKDAGTPPRIPPGDIPTGSEVPSTKGYKR